MQTHGPKGGEESAWLSAESNIKIPAPAFYQRPAAKSGRFMDNKRAWGNKAGLRE